MMPCTWLAKEDATMEENVGERCVLLGAGNSEAAKVQLTGLPLWPPAAAASPETSQTPPSHPP